MSRPINFEFFDSDSEAPLLRSDELSAMDVEPVDADNVDPDSERSEELSQASPDLLRVVDASYESGDELEVARARGRERRRGLDDEHEELAEYARRAHARVASTLPYRDPADHSQRSNEDFERAQSKNYNLGQKQVIDLDSDSEDYRGRSGAGHQSPNLSPVRSAPTLTPTPNPNANLAVREEDAVEELVLERDRYPRVKVMDLAITVPQRGDRTPSDVCSAVTAGLAALGKAVDLVLFVAETGPLDDHPHLHGWIHFVHPNPNVKFDDLDALIGVPSANGFRRNNYQKVKSKENYKKYLLKEQYKPDLPPMAGNYGRLDAPILDIRAWAAVASSKQSSRRGEICEFIRENKGVVTYHSLMEKFGMDVVARDERIYRLVISEYANAAPKVDWVPLPLSGDAEQNRLYSFLNIALAGLKAGKSLKVKNNCVVLYSPPNFHKTGLVKHIGRSFHFSTVAFNKSGFEHQLKPTERVDVLCLDSWTGDNIPSFALEKLMDCDPGANFNIKGDNYRFAKRPLIIINTNVHPSKWYCGPTLSDFNGAVGEVRRDCSNWEAIKARFELFELQRPLSGFEDPEQDVVSIPENLKKPHVGY